MGVSRSTPSMATVPEFNPAEGVHYRGYIHTVGSMSVYCTSHLRVLQMLCVISALHT
jgi:hypothetical protein